MCTSGSVRLDKWTCEQFQCEAVKQEGQAVGKHILQMWLGAIGEAQLLGWRAILAIGSEYLP